MPVRSTMQSSLIPRVRLLINDPAGVSQTFTDQAIQDTLDTTRLDVYNARLEPKITFPNGQISYLDYFAPLGMWEDDYVLKQNLTIAVTPSFVEPLVGHFQFSSPTLPVIFLTGKSYDVYRAAADMLEQLSAQWMLSYNFTADGQTLHREGASANIAALIKRYRHMQRPTTISLTRSDMHSPERSLLRPNGLGPVEADRMAKG